MPPPSTRSPGSETGPWFFCLRHEVHAGAIGIAMLGELDIAAADDAREVIARAQVDAAEVVCDLHDVSFIDAHGLRVLLDAATGARRQDTLFTVANPSASVCRLIDVLSLEAVVRGDAVPCLSPPPIADSSAAAPRFGLPHPQPRRPNDGAVRSRPVPRRWTSDRRVAQQDQTVDVEGSRAPAKGRRHAARGARPCSSAPDRVALADREHS